MAKLGQVQTAAPVAAPIAAQAGGIDPALFLVAAVTERRDWDTTAFTHKLYKRNKLGVLEPIFSADTELGPNGKRVWVHAFYGSPTPRNAQGEVVEDVTLPKLLGIRELYELALTAGALTPALPYKEAVDRAVTAKLIHRDSRGKLAIMQDAEAFMKANPRGTGGGAKQAAALSGVLEAARRIQEAAKTAARK